MSKFKSVLTKDERQEIALKAEFYGHNYWEFDSFCEQLEQAVLAKLQEQQEPFAYYIHENEEIGAYYTNQYYEAKIWKEKGVSVTPLYEHPSVSPVNDKPACESQNKEYDKQSKGFVKKEYANHQHEALCKSTIKRLAMQSGLVPQDCVYEFAKAIVDHVVGVNEMLVNHVISSKGQAEFDRSADCLELGIKAGKPRRQGYGWDDEATPSNKVMIQLMAKYHLQMLMGADYEKVIDFGRDVWNFAQEKMQSEPQKTVGKVRLKVELSTKEAQETIQGLVDVVDGYQLVPKEPVNSMIQAGVSLAMKSHLHGSYTWSHYMRDLYIAMLSEAPNLLGENDG